MKKTLFALLLIVSIGMLVAVESAPSAVVGYVKYGCMTGLNLVALPMDSGYAMASDVANAFPGDMDTINYWDAAGQQWVAASDIGFWDGDFPVAPGMVLFVNALTNFNLFSLGAMPATNASYALLPGLNTMMLPLNQSAITMAGTLGDTIGTLDTVNYWDNVGQQWVAASNIGFWDGDFPITIGMPLFVNSGSSITWPTRGMHNPLSSLRTSQK